MSRIYRVNDGYVAADDGGWLPGSYADEAAATAALELAKVDFPALAALVTPEARGIGDAYRPVTVAELQAVLPGGTVTG